MVRLILKYFNIYIVNEYEIYILGGSVIGVIIPGIMAQEMDRHGIIRTVSSLMILSIFIKAVVEVIYKAGGVNWIKKSIISPLQL